MWSNRLYNIFPHYLINGWIETELAFTLAKNATKPNPVEIIPLQTTRKENNWKTEETLARTVVTLETEGIKLVQSLMFMMMIMMISIMARFSKEKVIEYQMCFLIFLRTFFFLKHFSFWEKLSETWSETFIGVTVKCPFFLSDFNEIEFSRMDFRKIRNIKFHENPPTASRVVPSGQYQSNNYYLIE